MKRVARTATTSAITTVALLVGAVACSERPMEPVMKRSLRPDAPSLAVTPVDEYPRLKLTPNANGVVVLDRVCDVFIGDPVFEAPEIPQKYAHQLVVDVPPGTRIRLVPNAEMKASGSKVFTCDARGDDGRPVIDPITLHAAKGDGPQIFTEGVTLDLSGHSITVFPVAGTPDPGSTTGEVFENIGIALLGRGNTLMNAATVDVAAPVSSETGRQPGISRVWGFGHNIDVEAELDPTVRGRRYAADGITVDALAGPIFNLEAEGGFGVRLSSGTITITQVKSVNLDPVEGTGFEVRRNVAGARTVVSNSHFEGGAEGVFLREVSGVTLNNNIIIGTAGPGVNTREVVSTVELPIRVTNNKISNSTIGVLWGRESVNSGGLRIATNLISDSACGIGLSTDDASLGGQTTTSIANLNTLERVTNRTCVED